MRACKAPLAVKLGFRLNIAESAAWKHLQSTALNRLKSLELTFTCGMNRELWPLFTQLATAAPQLTSLVLHGQPFSGRCTVPANVWCLPQLKQLRIDDCCLHRPLAALAPGAAAPAATSALQSLFLDRVVASGFSNSVNLDFVTWLTSLSVLQVLHCSSLPALPTLAACTNLQELVIKVSRVDGCGVGGFELYCSVGGTVPGIKDAICHTPSGLLAGQRARNTSSALTAMSYVKIT